MDPATMMAIMSMLGGLSKQGGGGQPETPMTPPPPVNFAPTAPIAPMPMQGQIQSPMQGGGGPQISGGMDLSSILPGLGMQGSFQHQAPGMNDWSAMLGMKRQF